MLNVKIMSKLINRGIHLFSIATELQISTTKITLAKTGFECNRKSNNKTTAMGPAAEMLIMTHSA